MFASERQTNEKQNGMKAKETKHKEEISGCMKIISA
jgi:hypothetical protein